MSGGVAMAQRVKGPPWPTGEPCQLERSGRRMVGIGPYPWEDPGEMAIAEGREIRLWGAKLGAEGSTHTGHRQGRRLGKCAENNGYAKLDLRPFAGQFTTFWALPCRKARTLSTAMVIRRERAARVAQARCGVMMQFLAVSSGLSAGGGSVDRTSRPAPAMRPEFSASASASSSTRRPRLVLSSKAVGFISDRRRALTRFAVCGVSGQCRLTTSLSRKRVSSSTARTKGGTALTE